VSPRLAFPHVPRMSCSSASVSRATIFLGLQVGFSGVTRYAAFEITKQEESRVPRGISHPPRTKTGQGCRSTQCMVDLPCPSFDMALKNLPIRSFTPILFRFCYRSLSVFTSTTRSATVFARLASCRVCCAIIVFMLRTSRSRSLEPAAAGLVGVGVDVSARSGSVAVVVDPLAFVERVGRAVSSGWGIC
jgi:hypothetical protein